MTIRMTRTMRAGVSALAIALSLAATAQAQDRAYSIPAEPLSSSLREFARVSGEQIVFTDDLVRGKSAPALQGSFSADEALARILVGTDLVARRTSGGTIMIVRADSPPDLTADVPAMLELAARTNAPLAGNDMKTGQTLINTIIAPGLKARLRPLLLPELKFGPTKPLPV